jgi:hypothetical protein
VAKQIAQTRVVATRIDIDLAHRAWIVAQFGKNRMKAENQMSVEGHGEGQGRRESAEEGGVFLGP